MYYLIRTTLIQGRIKFKKKTKKKTKKTPKKSRKDSTNHRPISFQSSTPHTLAFTGNPKQFDWEDSVDGIHPSLCSTTLDKGKAIHYKVKWDGLRKSVQAYEEAIIAHGNMVGMRYLVVPHSMVLFQKHRMDTLR